MISAGDVGVAFSIKYRAASLPPSELLKRFKPMTSSHAKSARRLLTSVYCPVLCLMPCLMPSLVHHGRFQLFYWAGRNVDIR